MFPTTRQESKNLALELIAFLKTEIEDTRHQLEWSERNFSLLREFSNLKGAESFPTAKGTTPQDKRAQFLWDFIAYVRDKGILIAAESEHGLNIDGLKHDFEKLLYVRSPIKLLMCRMQRADDDARVKDELSKYMKSACSTFSPGEVFILYFVWWAGDKDENRDVAYYLQIEGESSHVALTVERFERI
ncbi:MAG TPA: hypothetical protein VFC39_07790 [Acidobacteriaceae bacterium]|nr:hypothetical protein [Acidobacteriaceae bacterium]